MSFYTQEELEVLGFKYLGKNVCLSKKTSIYNPANISIGNYSRIDDFCILSAGDDGIEIGRNVHIAIFCSLMGNGLIKLADFSGLSSRVSIYSSNDDYSGNYMTNPTVPEQFINVTQAPVIMGKHVIIGAGSIILPGVTLHDGAGVGALSLVKKDCEAFNLYLGSPARKIGTRSRKVLELETDLYKLG
ncbi:acyltransferase [Candidatus Venteria ishoeyi]|uniref:dTDP-4-amino-4,6-dideoxy-D-glucose acyltransferase n=1 Tax=Candidatus Venteria ishoeyi TaxID=1899563 RepID=A0A1H6FEQ7_9GAMM|nr:acyltransferase [Candidatus Venteria ishoeyi]SEH08550.1 dTDP-4-amino-4%2C6-dideoxy-D-glucose acyltransferase [Candidatus Venteria ishoeyi]